MRRIIVQQKPCIMVEIKDHPVGVEIGLDCGHTVWMNFKTKDDFSIGDEYYCKVSTCCDCGCDCC